MPPSEYVNELCSVVGILHLLVYRLLWYGLTSWEWEQLLWPSQLAFDGVLSPIRALSGSGKVHPAQFICNQSSDQLETWLGVQTIRIGFAQCVSVLWTLYSFTRLLALTTWSQVTWRRTNFVTRNILWHIEKYVFPYLRVPLRGCFLMGFPIYAALCLCAPCGNKGWRPRLINALVVVTRQICSFYERQRILPQKMIEFATKNCLVAKQRNLVY